MQPSIRSFTRAEWASSIWEWEAELGHRALYAAWLAKINSLAELWEALLDGRLHETRHVGVTTIERVRKFFGVGEVVTGERSEGVAQECTGKLGHHPTAEAFFVAAYRIGYEAGTRETHQHHPSATRSTPAGSVLPKPKRKKQAGR